MSSRDWTGEPVKANPVNADQALILDSEDTNNNKLIALSTIPVRENFGPYTGTHDVGDQLLTNIKALQYNQTTITYNATLAFDFDENEQQQITLTGDLTTLTTSNRGAGKSKSLILIAGGTDRTVTFNTDWKTSPSDPTFLIPANSVAVLSLRSTGTAETDVIAGIAEFS